MSFHLLYTEMVTLGPLSARVINRAHFPETVRGWFSQSPALRTDPPPLLRQRQSDERGGEGGGAYLILAYDPAPSAAVPARRQTRGPVEQPSASKVLHFASPRPSSFFFSFFALWTCLQRCSFRDAYNVVCSAPENTTTPFLPVLCNESTEKADIEIIMLTRAS